MNFENHTSDLNDKVASAAMKGKVQLLYGAQQTHSTPLEFVCVKCVLHAGCVLGVVRVCAAITSSDSLILAYEWVDCISLSKYLRFAFTARHFRSSEMNL